MKAGLQTAGVAMALMAAAPCLAQAPAVDGGGPVSGTLVSYTQDSATIVTKDGSTRVLSMTPRWTISTPRQLTVDTIKAGDFVASTNQPLDDHTGRSTEMRIFEPGYERDQGTKPAANARVETHGTVANVRQTGQGLDLEVHYAGGSRHLLVPTDLPVTRFAPVERGALKPGLTVRTVLIKGPDGIYRAGRLILDP